ncbi:hypothetical protein ONS95_010213 [Cadophora gregata]|uniref:uncharacterized protein n=1 Tax=Cadophora gregata TaxID=51156 RepID=UPI0026DC6CB4|nr:uncharacterized protein ONS95_010213 [Cadophora gregata]KAK0121939.1 hypothetical protein ONS95_010213 [Cadophora gregata]KAK0127419.1 hypothetical protein ONS96_006961 [Cadophora gregata f. sp. sojae]
MRGTQEQAIARIAWLEDIIRTQLPHVNLNDGPLPSGHPGQFGTASDGLGRASEIPSEAVPFSMGDFQQSMGSLSGQTMEEISPAPPKGTKRTLEATTFDSSLQDKSVHEDARSVALELGLLSLISDSRQMHYLGSSSGTLFASLFLSNQPGTGPTSESFPHSPNGSNGEVQHGIDKATPPALISPANQKNIEELFEQLRKILPNREECNMLLEQFFNHMHPNHPFLHYPSFNSAVHALYQCVEGPTPTSFQANGWPASAQPFPYNGEEDMSGGSRQFSISVYIGAFQLLMALSIGATLQIRRQRYSHNPKTFFNTATNLSNHVFGNISLPVLQCVLLVVVHGLIDPDGCDVWTLTHVAMAHSIDLGLQREASNSGLFNTTATDIRRRVFFCVYSLDR